MELSTLKIQLFCLKSTEISVVNYYNLDVAHEIFSLDKVTDLLEENYFRAKTFFMTKIMTKFMTKEDPKNIKIT